MKITTWFLAFVLMIGLVAGPARIGPPDQSVGHARPGRGGQMPPSLSIARLMRP